MREPCSWMNPVPTNVTVIGEPVHGLTSGNTSRIGNSVGRSAAAGAANASATTLSRATTSLITGLPPQVTLGTPRLDVVISCEELQAWRQPGRQEYLLSSLERANAL